MVEKGEVGICGGMYHVETGVVHFYEGAQVVPDKQLTTEAIPA
jgi:hypothetical protein